MTVFTPCYTALNIQEKKKGRKVAKSPVIKHVAVRVNYVIPGGGASSDDEDDVKYSTAENLNCK